MQNPEGLESEIKALIVEALMLEDIGPDEIETEAPLFIEGLGLDSIDALELAMALEEKYGSSSLAATTTLCTVDDFAGFLLSETPICFPGRKRNFGSPISRCITLFDR